MNPPRPQPRYPTFAEGWQPRPPLSWDPCIEARAPVLIADAEHAELERLAAAARVTRPVVAQLLAQELRRAQKIPARDLPRDVVCMNAIVEYRHDDLDQVRRVQLVYPERADIDARRLSVLTSVGAALIGLAEGTTTELSIRPGSRARLSVLSVVHPDIPHAR